MAMLKDVGIVVIGRNEGRRLTQCLNALITKRTPIVYVDSGSIDGSRQNAERMGVDVVLLDDSCPHTAARGRNAGFEYLYARYSHLRFVQFLDGDCLIAPGWLEIAVRKLSSEKEVAIVCGRRRERFPEATVYNQLCEIEWNTPVGETSGCGGDFMIRTDAFQDVGGFNSTIIAAEDRELCIRVRRAGWVIWRLNADMSIHDADMTTAIQWWCRALRTGYGYAQVYDVHRKSGLPDFQRQLISSWIWGGVVPSAIISVAYMTSTWGFLLVSIYGLAILRIMFRSKRLGMSNRDARIYAVSCIAAKFPELVGQLRYWRDRFLSRDNLIIEYK